eukprot:TRINITY_DN4057_c0_g1_i14.p1 TRINITY_DN4057_c0_g1~~TRINITY_DN4057_c0_g1_i14.p1  ORF type:complete len:105 (+),score=4.65 TRINITY_DN4057_c0_g1_i14:46-315(+)
MVPYHKLAPLTVFTVRMYAMAGKDQVHAHGTYGCTYEIHLIVLQIAFSSQSFLLSSESLFYLIRQNFFSSLFLQFQTFDVVERPFLISI